MTTDNPSAFPVPTHVVLDETANTFRGDITSSEGMSLRDWFAGMALQPVVGMATNVAMKMADAGVGTNDQIKELHDLTGWAKCAYQLADAMLAERAKK